MFIDSGGAYGVLPSSVLDTGQTSGTVPAGTPISVYASSGEQLYSHATTVTNTPIVTTEDLANTGMRLSTRVRCTSGESQRLRDDNLRLSTALSLLAGVCGEWVCACGKSRLRCPRHRRTRWGAGAEIMG